MLHFVGKVLSMKYAKSTLLVVNRYVFVAWYSLAHRTADGVTNTFCVIVMYDSEFTRHCQLPLHTLRPDWTPAKRFDVVT